MTLERYTPDRAREWDRLVEESRNGTFLHKRPYMDYHSDRFEDHSLMAFKNGRLAGLLPANVTSGDGRGMTLHSHQGLTYGGWITPARHFDGNDMMALWRAWLEFCAREGIGEIDYKPVPHVFTRFPAQEDEYMLFRSGATLTESNLSTAIDLRGEHGFNTLQRRHLRKALSLSPDITETRNPEPFWRMLDECLRERHDATPVHSCAELRLLMERFPHNIRLHQVELDGRLCAGVCVYDTGVTAHAQYIATTPEGRAHNMLTPLFHHLIEEVYAGRRYFDFGISNEDHGRLLNAGLLRQKCALGGSGVVFTRWGLDVEKGLEHLVAPGV